MKKLYHLLFAAMIAVLIAGYPICGSAAEETSYYVDHGWYRIEDGSVILYAVDENWDGKVPSEIVINGKRVAVNEIDGYLYSKMRNGYTKKQLEGIKTISIPNTIKHVDSDAFLYALDCQDIDVYDVEGSGGEGETEEEQEFAEFYDYESEGCHYFSRDGVLMYNDGTHNVMDSYPFGRTDTTYRVPNNVSVVYAYFNSALQIVDLNKAHNVGSSVFKYAENLKVIKGGGKCDYLSDQLVVIDGALYEKGYLEADEGGDKYQKLMVYPMGSTKTTFKIDKNTTDINRNAFYHEDEVALKKINIPRGLYLEKGIDYFGSFAKKNKYETITEWNVHLVIDFKNNSAISYAERFEPEIPHSYAYNAPIFNSSYSVSSTLVTANKFLVKWSKDNDWPSSHTIKYKVEMKAYGGKWKTVKKSTTKNSLYVGGLVRGRRYTFRVTPYATLGGKKYTGKSKTTGYKYTIKTVSKPTVKKYSKNYVKVSWKDVPAETGYQVYKMKKVNGKYKKVSSFKTAKTYRKIKATKGKTYYYKVRAYKKVGNKTVYGAWSKVKAYKLK